VHRGDLDHAGEAAAPPPRKQNSSTSRPKGRPAICAARTLLPTTRAPKPIVVRSIST
jgi:hypothetical protein